MPFQDAIKLIRKIYSEFSFDPKEATDDSNDNGKSEDEPPKQEESTLPPLVAENGKTIQQLNLTISESHAIAHLLTPFCQSIMGWRKKSPIWLFTAKQPRSGKDYLAMISPIIHEGVAVQDPPLEEEAEFKRRITSAIVSGRRFQHMANCRGALNSPSLEAAITSEFWSDRLIGTSEAPVMINEIIFSMSYNGNPDITDDLAFRSRRVHLSKSAYVTNKKGFITPNLHSLLFAWKPLLLQNHPKVAQPKPEISRQNVLAALLSLVENWVDVGRPNGGTFTSFPEWAQKVGGIMKWAGLGDITTVSAAALLKNPEKDAWQRFAYWFASNKVGYLPACKVLEILEHSSETFPELFLPITNPTPTTATPKPNPAMIFGKKLSAEIGNVRSPYKIEKQGENAEYRISFKEEEFQNLYVDFLEVFQIPDYSPMEIFEELKRSPASPEGKANSQPDSTANPASSAASKTAV